MAPPSSGGGPRIPLSACSSRLVLRSGSDASAAEPERTRGRERGERRRPSKAGTSPESNPVRAFSPGSSCTPLWFPADGLSAAVVLFLRMAGDFWQGRLKPGSASAGWLSRILSPPQVVDGIAVLGLPGSSRFPTPSGGRSWQQQLSSAVPRSGPRLLRYQPPDWLVSSQQALGYQEVRESRGQATGTLPSLQVQVFRGFRWTASLNQPRSSHVLDTKLAVRQS